MWIMGKFYRTILENIIHFKYGKQMINYCIKGSPILDQTLGKIRHGLAIVLPNFVFLNEGEYYLNILINTYILWYMKRTEKGKVFS